MPKAEDEAADLLAVARGPCIVELLPWTPHGERVVARMRELEQAAVSDVAMLEALTLLHLRYHRLWLAAKLRLTVTAAVQVHLGISPETGGGVYFVRVLNQLEIRGAGAGYAGSDAQAALEGLP